MSFRRTLGRRREIPAIEVSLLTMPASNRPRAVWTGAISFGLLNAPVRMYSAIDEKDLRFNQLHATDGGRIGYVKVCKADNEPVPADEIVKGYEVSKGEYVRMTDEDFEAARGEQHRGITIHDFVPADQIDPVYFERTYYLGPAEGAGEAIYALLVDRHLRAPRPREPGLPARPLRRDHAREDVLRRRDPLDRRHRPVGDEGGLQAAEDGRGPDRRLHVGLRARALQGHLPRAAAGDRRPEAPGQDDEAARARGRPDRARPAHRADGVAGRRPRRAREVAEAGEEGDGVEVPGQGRGRKIVPAPDRLDASRP